MIEKTFNELLKQDNFSKSDLVRLLQATPEESKQMFKLSGEIKKQYIGNFTYFRGLIEFSNICAKNCFYCGIRAENRNTQRYSLTDEEVIEAAKYAFDNNYGSLVLQSGEVETPAFIDRIDKLIHAIKDLSGGKLGLTLSLGEQTEAVYRRWYDSGAHRYLLRIEASNKELYAKLHPNNQKHDYDRRLDCIKTLQKIGYQAGTGVMIGLPFQTLEDLADDLLFIKEMDIDMVGMGPYIEHEDTPLYQYKDSLLPKKERFNLALKMVSILRIMMKDINMAATTAMQAIDKTGREKALMAGANIIMPNLTPVKYRENYLLYEDKPCIDEEASDCKNCLEARIKLAGDKIGYGEWGDSKHFKAKKK